MKFYLSGMFLCCGIVAFLAGYNWKSYLGRTRTPMLALTAPPEIKARTVGTSRPLERAEQTSLGIDTPEETTKKNTRITKLNEFAKYAKSRFISINVSLLDPGGVLSQQCLELFELTLPEADALQKAIDDTYLALSAHARVSAQVVHADTSKLVISVPKLGESDNIKEKFAVGARAALGPELYELFSEIQVKNINKAMSSFGVGGQKVSIQRTQSANSPLVILDEQFDSSGRAITYAIIAHDVSNLPERYSWLKQYTEHLATLTPQASVPKPHVEGTIIVGRKR